METSVKLQDGFSYSLLPIIGLIIIIVATVLVVIIMEIMKAAEKKAKKKPVVKIPSDITSIRTKYLLALDKVKLDFEDGKISIRETYTLMSSIIREFIHKTTGINVKNYSLQDIRTLDMPILEQLVTEYYAPEFARESNGDVQLSYEKTRKAMEEWN